MAIDDSEHMFSEPEKFEPETPEEEMTFQASLAKRANDFLAGRPTVHQHKNPLTPGRQQTQASDPLFESVREEKSKRGQVKDPEHDHRLRQNKAKDDERDPSEHVETEREREARQREEANDKRREDEEIRRAKEEEERKKLQEKERNKVIKLQNTPFGRQPHNHFQPLSDTADQKLNEIIYHVAYGPEIRKTMGVRATIAGLDDVRELLNTKIAAIVGNEPEKIEKRNELIGLNSKIANLLIEAGYFKLG